MKRLKPYCVKSKTVDAYFCADSASAVVGIYAATAEQAEQGWRHARRLRLRRNAYARKQSRYA